MNINYKTAIQNWTVRKIAVIGPGIVGMPMAALLSHSGIEIGSNHAARVVVIQRNSKNSGWKVDAVNKGQSPIGGIEPDLDRIIKESVKMNTLSASHDYAELKDADVILVCVQTDKKELEPDYGPLFSCLNDMTGALSQRKSAQPVLIIFESTLAPTTMITVIKEFFAGKNLLEGRDILLGNSPNRVMPGRLVERVSNSDKIAAGLSPETPEKIQALYQHIVTKGKIYKTNSLTAEVVKTLENAYRDVRIAFAAEIVRFCDERDINFYAVRDRVNSLLTQSDSASKNPNDVPSGGVLVPGIGVGGHCLPKDGILLWWRKLEQGKNFPGSLILESRRINDESPGQAVKLFEKHFGSIRNKRVALFGAAYRFNSEDTRNSPSLALALLLLNLGCKVTLHDPFVKPDDQNLLKFNLTSHFTRNYETALESCEYLIFCTAHKVYVDKIDMIKEMAPGLIGIMDGCNLFPENDYPGVGRGKRMPSKAFISFVHDSFKIMEKGIANEVMDLISFFNENYASDAFNKVDFMQVRQLAGTCVTGCKITMPGPVGSLPEFEGFSLRLAKCAGINNG